MAVRVVTPYLDGRFTPRRRRPTEPVTAPWNGRPLAEIVAGDAADLLAALRGARRAQRVLAGLPRHARAEILERVSRAIGAERPALAQLIARDAGKPLTFALAEVDRAATTFRVAAEEARRFGVQAFAADADPRGAGYSARVEHFPLGVIAAISPFNFPLNLAAHKVAPAIATGNTVVLKPPPQAPLAAFRLAELVAEAGAPPGTLQVLHLPVPLAERLATDSATAMLSFTGSARVGWHLKERAARKRVVLELGGNAAAIVHRDAGNLDALAERIAWGAFGYAGQVCIKVQRLLVHVAIARRFTGLVVEASRRLPAGDPLRPDTIVGPMIDAAAMTRVREWIAEAEGSGARAILKGTARGRLLRPTILSGVAREAKVWREEVFGPVLTVTPYRDWDEAIELANDSGYGLQAGVFTRDAGRIDRAFRALEVGGVIVNDLPTLRLDHLPYGGIKASGFGREGLAAAMEEMTEKRLLLARGLGAGA
jgi:glyceraldehyde-3-phosphate dehydrogenase (NADP+)